MPGMWINPQPGILRYPFSFTFMVISFLEGVAQKNRTIFFKRRIFCFGQSCETVECRPWRVQSGEYPFNEPIQYFRESVSGPQSCAEKRDSGTGAALLLRSGGGSDNYRWHQSPM